MSHESHPKVAFVGWNPFQFLHFAPVIGHVPGAAAVIEKKRGVWKSMDPGWPDLAAERVHHLDAAEMRDLDGRYDVLVCQTPFTGIERIRKSRIAMLQYGYAKEAHNYGPWRAFADVCMTYGPYASRKIAPFAPCVATGNPRFASWPNPEFHRKAREKHAAMLDPAKKTVLYAPTWGGLSSHDHFADAVAALSRDFNVIVKIHHISARFGEGPDHPLRRKFPHLCGAEHDLMELLSVADVLLSDFSGAIFDAIQGEVPVILLGAATAENASRSDRHSLEQARRDELGTVVATPGDLASAVRQVLAAGAAPGLDALRNELFTDATGAPARIAATLGELAAGAFSRSQSQEYVRDAMAELHRLRTEPTLRQRLLRLLGKRPDAR